MLCCLHKSFYKNLPNIKKNNDLIIVMESSKVSTIVLLLPNKVSIKIHAISDKHKHTRIQ